MHVFTLIFTALQGLAVAVPAPAPQRDVSGLQADSNGNNNGLFWDWGLNWGIIPDWLGGSNNNGNNNGWNGWGLGDWSDLAGNLIDLLPGNRPKTVTVTKSINVAPTAPPTEDPGWVGGTPVTPTSEPYEGPVVTVTVDAPEATGWPWK